MPAKFAFVHSVTQEMTPFLTMYQTDKLMVPFLGTDLEQMIHGLMVRFVKAEVMDKATTTTKLIQVDVKKGSKNNSRVWDKRSQLG